MDFELELFIREHLPVSKKEYSRDMVELLLKLAWEKAKGKERSNRAEQEREDRYGPWSI